MISCNTDGPTKKIEKYYDIRELIISQLDLLDSLNPELIKSAWIDQMKNKQQLQPDSLWWAKELEIFLKLDINKPVLIDSYQIDTTIEGNQKIVTYDALNPEDVKVEFIHLYFENASDQLLKLEAMYKEISPLYKTKRNLSLILKPINATNLLSAYKVKGQQKIILKDTVNFQLESALNY